MIITRRKLFIALLLFTCIAVGMGFVFGRRIEQLRRFPPAYETEEASTGEVAPEIADIPIAEEKEPQDVGVGLAEKPSVDTEVRGEELEEARVPDGALIEEPVTERIAVVPKVKMPIFYVDTKEPVVALTFDISWGQQQVMGVLEILREKNVKSTFFLSGPWAKRYPNFVQEIAKAGHGIASHGDAHVDLSNYSREEIEKNISTAHKDLVDTAGKVSPYFRPPNGDYDDVVIDTARSLGYETVIWAVDSLDWKNPGVDFMVERVLGRTFPGAIVLMHASDSSQQIQDALPLIIDGLREKGYRLVPLSELMTIGTPVRWDPR